MEAQYIRSMVKDQLGDHAATDQAMVSDMIRYAHAYLRDQEGDPPGRPPEWQNVMEAVAHGGGGVGIGGHR